MSTSLDNQPGRDETEESIAAAALTTSTQNLALAGETPSNDNDPQSQASDSGATTTAAKTSLCGVCNVNTSKYKCPRCYLPYCSVACNKTHRENHPSGPEPMPEPTNSADTTQSHVAAETHDPTNPFRALETSDKLRLLFQKYPSLPDMLLQIHAATLPPPDTGSQNRGIPASLLKGMQNKEKWNHDIGIQNGKEALRKARRAHGEDGDAVREYSELILHLMEAQDSEADVTTLLRQQLAKEDTKLIERLMAEETR
ncbi:hypothetical protein G7046_g1417 [Stylonectria norvegica]|nr:hypothetical protein G7046_g1417 [Stylonectria norvegica]